MEFDTKGLVPWLWRGYLRQHTLWIIVAFVLMSLEGATLGGLSYMIKPMFDEIFVAGDRAAVPLIGGVIFAVFLLRAVAGFCHRMLMTWVGQKIAAELQSDLMTHMLNLDNAWFKTMPPGNLISRVRGDTGAASTIWATVLAAGGRDLVATISLFAVALSVDWKWTLIAIAGVPLVILPVTILQRLVRRFTRVAREAAAVITIRLDEIFHGVTTVKLNRLEEHEIGRFNDALQHFIKSKLQSMAGRTAMPALIDVVAGIGFFGVLTYGGYQIIDGEKTVGEFMSFFTAMALVFEPLRRLSKITGAWQAALASLERVYQVFQAQPSITSPAQPKALPMAAGAADIVLDNVSLNYDDLPVLNNLSLTAKAGQMTALVGASGAGKSTVFNVLTRLVEPHSGSVSLGGVPIQELSLPDLRSQFSVVTQDSLLFDETVRDNIVLGRDEVADAQLMAALEAAHVSDFMEALPEGLDSPAGTRGTNLSGGQRQRVAIARALLRDAPILLLDEATSALDAKSEKVVQQALERLSEGRTTLVIAHRLATVRDADNIIVMDKGRVVEQGTHDQLLAKDGVYSGLYKLQFAMEA